MKATIKYHGGIFGWVWHLEGATRPICRSEDSWYTSEEAVRDLRGALRMLRISMNVVLIEVQDRG